MIVCIYIINEFMIMNIYIYVYAYYIYMISEMGRFSTNRIYNSFIKFPRLTAISPKTFETRP